MKKSIAVVLCLLFLFGGIGQRLQVCAEEKAIQVCLDGVMLDFDVAPYIEEGRVLVPMRRIFEALGYVIQWDETLQRVTAERDNSWIQLTVGDKLAVLDHYEWGISLDVPPCITEDRTMVPLRFVAEVADYDVLWDEQGSTVYIENSCQMETSRPFQYCALQGKTMWAEGICFALDGTFFQEGIGDGEELQLCGTDLYYTNAEHYVYRTNLQTGETSQILFSPVSGILIRENQLFYIKEDGYLYRSDLIGGQERRMMDHPCSDYRVAEDNIYYIHGLNHQLYVYKMAEGSTAQLYGGYTSCFDVVEDMIYYGKAERQGEEIRYLGIGSYNMTNQREVDLPELETAQAESLWVLQDDLFYQTPDSGTGAELYRYGLNRGYYAKVLDGIKGSSEIHGSYICYYAEPEEMEQDQKPLLYLAETDGSNCVSIQEIMFSALFWSHIQGNIPAEEDFDLLLKKELSAFFEEPYAVQYRLLRVQPIQIGIGFPKYYVWAAALDAEGNIMKEGAMILKAINKQGFVTEYFLSREDILADPELVLEYFPALLCGRIQEWAKSGEGGSLE